MLQPSSYEWPTTWQIPSSALTISVSLVIGLVLQLSRPQPTYGQGAGLSTVTAVEADVGTFHPETFYYVLLPPIIYEARNKTRRSAHPSMLLS